MKRVLFKIISSILVITHLSLVCLWDVSFADAGDEAAWLMEQEPKPAPQNFEWQGQTVTAKEFARLTGNQQKERQSKLKEIREKSKVEYDDQGNLVYVMPDGTRNHFEDGMTVESFIEQNNNFDRAETRWVDEAVKRQAAYEVYIASQKIQNYTELAEIAEALQIQADIRAKRKSQKQVHIDSLNQSPFSLQAAPF